MIKRHVRRVIGLSLMLVVLLAIGCGKTEFYKDYELSQPSEFWCSGGAATPFPPYCHPDRW